MYYFKDTKCHYIRLFKSMKIKTENINKKYNSLTYSMEQSPS